MRRMHEYFIIYLNEEKDGINKTGHWFNWFIKIEYDKTNIKQTPIALNPKITIPWSH